MTPGVTTGVDVLGLITEGGGDLCASLDVPGAPIMVEEEPCLADAGTLKAGDSDLCFDDKGNTLTATPDGNAVVPEGYTTLYVLTQGEELVIVNAGAEPMFTVTESGTYTIHTFVYPSDFDPLSVVTIGETTGFDVNALLIQGGGELCASLDVAGAQFTVSDPDAGTLTADETPVTLMDGTATISATPNGDINVPEGFSSVYVLTQGEGLVIINASGTPSFEVTEPGLYTIHTFVFPSDFDPFTVVTPGVTTGVDVLGLITEGGGDLCASLDVPGAPIMVEEEKCTAYAGTLYSDHPIVCINDGYATITAIEEQSPVIPNGYEQIFVLTEAFGLTILDANSAPEFMISQAGFYRIHSLVYNPNTLDLGIVEFGTTTGYDVFGLIEEGGGEICASLDVHGALNLVLPEWICDWFYGSNSYSGRNNEFSLIEDYVTKYPDYPTFERSLLESDDNLRVYPNPVVQDLNIDTKKLKGELFTYKIFDISGRLISAGTLNDPNKDLTRIQLDVREGGLYIMTLESQYRRFERKLNVMR